MKKLAYILIDDSLTPRKAADELEFAKKSGFDSVIVMHREDAPFYTTQYKEQLLSLFRAAYRSKVKLYIGDDSGAWHSGSGFGQVYSVRDVRYRGMRKKSKSEVAEGEEILAEKDGECVVSFCFDDKEAESFGFYPDVTNPECANMVIDCVYKPLLRDYSKFKGYEFAGFFCNAPYALQKVAGYTTYMKAVVDRFEQEYKRKPDFFGLVEEKKDFEAYCSLAEKCAEENFLAPLERYCKGNGVELMAGSTENEYGEFCERNNLIHITKGAEKGAYTLGVIDIESALPSLEKGGGCVLKIMHGMGKIAKLQEFFEKNRDAEIVSLDEFKRFDKDCYIIKGNGNCEGVGLLLDGEWCILDWENDAVYEFDKRGVYTFTPGGFLCIMKKTEDMYPEPLPARVGGVLTKELEYAAPVVFTVSGNTVKFTLPEESLSGKYIRFTVSGNYINVKMGYNRQECISSPCVFPLYDFLCGNECEAYVGDRKMLDICIMKKKD